MLVLTDIALTEVEKIDFYGIPSLDIYDKWRQYFSFPAHP